MFRKTPFRVETKTNSHCRQSCFITERKDDSQTTPYRTGTGLEKAHILECADGGVRGNLECKLHQQADFANEVTHAIQWACPWIRSCAALLATVEKRVHIIMVPKNRTVTAQKASTVVPG